MCRFSKVCRFRQRQGSSLVELAAALVVIIPLVFTLLFAAVEMTTAYMIHTVLSQSAHMAARNLAIAYPVDRTIAQNRSAQDSLVFDNVRHSGIINSSAQFDDAVFDTTADPPTVSVTVHYASGDYGLPVFPIDLLGLEQLFHLSVTSSYRLEED